MSDTIETSVAVIGAGLSGLRIADHLEQAGVDYCVLEARDRIGGRIDSGVRDGAAFDLGPAWFWQGQPRMAALAKRYDLTVFEQYAQGQFRYEDQQGRIQQGQGAGSMQGSLRISGGMSALCHKLFESLTADRVHLNFRVAACRKTAQGVTLEDADGRVVIAERVVFALPLRLVPEITWTPSLPTGLSAQLRDTPTWMAGQAKAIALYTQPFWRTDGLSGDAMSHVGPMVEMHDASPATGGPYALFGFIGIPPQSRSDTEALRQAIVAQLTRLFGDEAARPLDVIIKDWAKEPATSTHADRAPLRAHPMYRPISTLPTPWSSTAFIAGTEAASEFGGYLEGALTAADQAANDIIAQMHSPERARP